jgi:very-short-patch-repair endonuclease
MVIEVDGGYHVSKRGMDKYRDQFLKQIGIQTIRFSDWEVIHDIDKVEKQILRYCVTSPVKGR